MSFKELVSVLQDILTMLAALVGGSYAYFKILRHRILQQAVHLEIGEPRLLADNRTLIFDVEVKNIGRVKIEAQGCQAEVQFLAVDPSASGAPVNATLLREPQFKKDPQSWYTIDRGERNTFAYRVPLAAGAQACVIRFQYDCTRKVDRANHMGWVTERWHVLPSEVVKAIQAPAVKTAAT